MVKPKILIIGHGRHGKDTVAARLQKNWGYSVCDSSRFVCEHAVFPVMRTTHGYNTWQECYNDRHNHRQQWYDLISAYNTPPERLARALLAKYDVYTGMRSYRELSAAYCLFNHVIWVDRSMHLPPEASMDIPVSAAHYYIDNNGTLDQLYEGVDALMHYLEDR